VDDLKHIYREGEQKVKETAREIDGHDASDDVGNAGDEVRKDLGNAGDDARRAEREADSDTATTERSTPDRGY
jgi:hypothetical protein